MLLLSSVIAFALNSKTVIALMSYRIDTFPNVSKVAHVTREQMKLAVGHVNALQVIPQGKTTWKKFLADSLNKEELFEFLSSEANKNQSYPDSNLVSRLCISGLVMK